MSSRSRKSGSSLVAESKARRIFQLMRQRQLQQEQLEAASDCEFDAALPDKQQQGCHNKVTDALPFGLFTSDQ